MYPLFSISSLNHMIWLIAALLSALIFGFSGFLMKVGCERGHSSSILLFGMYITGTISFAISLLIQQDYGLSILVIASSVVVGLGSAVGNDYTVRALEVGPASLSSPLINLNIVFIILMSLFLYNESLKINEVIAIGLFIVSCGLLSLDPKESIGIKDPKWFSYVIIAIFFIFLRNGGLKITNEIGLNNTLILFYAYLFSLILFAVKYLPTRKLQFNNKQGLLIGCVAGFFSYGGLELYSYALITGPASIVAPIFSLRSIVMVVMSVLIYKETLTFYQKLSLLTLFAGMAVISLK